MHRVFVAKVTSLSGLFFLLLEKYNLIQISNRRRLTWKQKCWMQKMATLEKVRRPWKPSFAQAGGGGELRIFWLAFLFLVKSQLG